MVYVVFFQWWYTFIEDAESLSNPVQSCWILFGFPIFCVKPNWIPTLQIPYLEIPQNWAGEIMFFAGGMDVLGCRNILAQSGHVRSGWFRAMPRVWSAVRMAPGIPIVSRVPFQPVKWHRVVMGCAVPTVQVDSSLKRRMPQNPTCFLVMFHVPKVAPKNGTWVLERPKRICCKSWRIRQNSHGISFMEKNLMSHYEWTDLVGSHCLVSELMGNLSRYIPISTHFNLHRKRYGNQ